MRTDAEFAQLGEQARSLRRAGKSRTEIKQIIDIHDNALLTEWLRGVPLPEWTRRPIAKDDLRDQARELRRQGLKYRDIAVRLHIPLSSVSLWASRRRPPRSER